MKTMKNKTKKEVPNLTPETSTELVPQSLSKLQMTQLYADTPKKYVRERVGPAGKKLSYVEVGYVIKRLNEVFGPLNWDFKITDKIEKPNEVIVQGELTIKDHKGNSVTKTQFGQADFKQNVAGGDIYKAATSDALKKCASLLGIALDVYSPLLEADYTAKPALQNAFKGQNLTSVAPERLNELITQPQMRKLFVLLKILGKTKEELEVKMGPVEKLNKWKASELIDIMDKKVEKKKLNDTPIITLDNEGKDDEGFVGANRNGR